ARLGCEVVIHEMRPSKQTPAHQTGEFAELVCSNSLKSKRLTSASGLLKEELSRLGSLIMSCALGHEVPAGQALAVDRQGFAACVSQTLRQHPRVSVVSEEVTDFPLQGEEPWIIASGPLTSSALAESLRRITGSSQLYFYDAVAPIVALESLDLSRIYRASRYGREEADYLNCPLDKEQYQRLHQELLTAECHPLHDFEEIRYFEGCIPIEEMARRGAETLAFGPLKPVGLEDPGSGLRPYAVVQLRQDNAAGDLYNLVGFQTNLKYGEQDRIFRLIPGLENAEFLRYGRMHRNIFLSSPELLRPSLQLKAHDMVLCAGQLIGVEGYLESAAMGWLAGQNAARLIQDKELLVLPDMTMLGALVHYITCTEAKHFQPMNAIFGILPSFEASGKKMNKQQRQEEYVKRSLEALAQWMKKV
ncbi:MAG: methylenetetrahydrofolate--tRNA-(uracil(54)-C(5))-methyltransferase (FADH(2)-oxidizing) TrmFO, partial [Symbiobacteriaceae bacterium]|nr:methylenetetrahydrofolate--tRNA-(uracil(54)-C(5))-methyltransferase (FADH(2)-oxidizing) TrmFO [Symbiobacteriaceae bacterium]